MITRAAFRALLAASALAAHAATVPRLDAQRREPLFTRGDAATVVGLSLGSAAAVGADEAVARWFQAPARQRSRPLQVAAHAGNWTAIPLMPLAAVGLWAGGRLGGDARTATLGLRMTEAIAAATVVTALGKLTVGRTRPQVSHDSSRAVGFLRGIEGDLWTAFPSGHTAIAFATASVLDRQLGRWHPERRTAIAVAGYTVATLAGAARMYDDRHWLSDVLGGAAVGVLSGALVVRAHNRNPGSAVDRWFLGGSLSTAGNGLALAVTPLP